MYKKTTTCLSGKARSLKKCNKNLIIITDSIIIGNEWIDQFSCGKLIKDRVYVPNGNSGIHKVNSTNLPYSKSVRKFSWHGV